MPGKPLFRWVLTTVALVPGLNFNVSAQQSNNLKYVDPFIGTAKSSVLTKWGNEGGTYPGAVAPSGAIQLSPETRISGSKGYDYTDTTIYYFSCVGHFSGFPGGSAGRFFVMPVNVDANFAAGKYHRRFSHKNEEAHPGYYKVAFDDDHTIIEATSTARTGMFRFTFPANMIPRIFISDTSGVMLQNKKVLQFLHGNVVINFSEEYSGVKQVSGGRIFTFANDPDNKNSITLKISASSVGLAGAQNNIDREIGSFGFDQVRKQTNDEWAKKLAAVDVTDSNEQNKTVFYTALYHSLLVPWVIDDADGQYTGADGRVYQKSGHNQYGGFSPWDTFRSLNPLLTLFYPDKEKDVILSMLDIYKQTGHLPTESMTGNHAIPIIVDSYLKGINGFDKDLVYKALKSNVTRPSFVQQDMDIYQKNGYIPFTSSESVTRTVEYAYDDWALAQYAKQVAHNDQDYQLLLNRGYSYRNLLNPGELFLLPRNKREFKLQPGMSGYKEGDQWVYTYFVPHNAKDLINLLGGNDQFTDRLDSAFSHNVILFDNETVFHLPYLFNQAGKPSLTQKWCRKIMTERFSATPGGLPGNDDLGSTSSWYIFSAMGLYPVCPGRPLYAIGSPMFQSVTLHLQNGKNFIINSANSSLTNPFIQSLSVNGKSWQQLIIPHSALLAGGEMVFNMGSQISSWPANNNPSELSETRHAPKCKIVNSSITKTIVEPDELLAIKFSVTNKGSSATKTINLMVDGKRYGYRNCFVASGQTITDSISFRLYPIGRSLLKLGTTAPVMVTVKSPKTTATHSYRITGLTAIPMVRSSEQQQISYTVQNIGGLQYVSNIPVMVNDSVVFRDTLTLAPGEKKQLSHHFANVKKGFQKVIIDGNAVNYKVYQDNRESLLMDISPAADSLIIDRSGFNNNGHIIYANTDHTKTQSGKLLIGDNCFITVPHATSVDMLGETVTMMVWVYPTKEKSGLVDIFTKGDTNVLQVMNGKTLTFFAGGWGRGDCTVDLPADWLLHWHHIAGVCAGKTIYVYIDGILKGTTVMDETANLSVNNQWVLGRNEEFPSERMFNGYIGRARLFKVALSQEEINAVFNSDKDFIKQ